MQVENLKAKRFFVPCGDEIFPLDPAAGVVTLPADTDTQYLKALEKQGQIKIHGDIEDAEFTQVDESDDELQALRDQYEALAGKKPHGAMKADKLQEKIDEMLAAE